MRRPHESPTDSHGPTAIGLPEPSAYAPIYNALHQTFTRTAAAHPHHDPGSVNGEDQPPAGGEAATDSPRPAEADQESSRTGPGPTVTGLRKATVALRLAHSAAVNASASHTATPAPTDRPEDPMLDATHDLFDALSTLLHRELTAANPDPSDTFAELVTIVSELRDLTGKH